ncbi:hypothetical protein SMD44_07398 [Streptomyces alboflavus]|uniref:Uncharacterized protein n=1 Tax=Streptomyces alboflavus TaxID=67267 RepID=A0A1Z1WNC2_9ACTN|nr:hypothetical protein [Streptomyces alboflavus]ARX87913.1 hypothetical protein SMD44_07398 [Streptomyces alboflavus]
MENENDFAEIMLDMTGELKDFVVEEFKRVTVKRVEAVGAIAQSARAAGLSPTVVDEISSDVWSLLYGGYDGA